MLTNNILVFIVKVRFIIRKQYTISCFDKSDKKPSQPADWTNVTKYRKRNAFFVVVAAVFFDSIKNDKICVCTFVVQKKTRATRKKNESNCDAKWYWTKNTEGCSDFVRDCVHLWFLFWNRFIQKSIAIRFFSILPFFIRSNNNNGIILGWTINLNTQIKIGFDVVVVVYLANWMCVNLLKNKIKWKNSTKLIEKDALWRNTFLFCGYFVVVIVVVALFDWASPVVYGRYATLNSLLVYTLNYFIGRVL